MCVGIFFIQAPPPPFEPCGAGQFGYLSGFTLLKNTLKTPIRNKGIENNIKKNNRLYIIV